jgi:hypothetical protein
MADDILFNKVAIVERCLARIHEEYQGREDELETNQTRQDAIVLNLQRNEKSLAHLAKLKTCKPSSPAAVAIVLSAVATACVPRAIAIRKCMAAKVRRGIGKMHSRSETAWLMSAFSTGC